MADVLADKFASPSKKRDHNGEVVQLETPESPNTSVLGGSGSDHSALRNISPAPSDASSLTELTSTGLASPATKPCIPVQTADANASTPNKKRKLTFAEREVENAVKRRQKEEKQQQKAEAKAKRDEDARLKAMERRRKEEEKEACRRTKEIELAEKKKISDTKKQERETKKQVKEAEKLARQDEKAQKEAEKMKKERSQMKLGAFFGRPAPQSTPPLTPENLASRSSSRRSSVASVRLDEIGRQPDHQDGPTNSEFHKYILPFFLLDHTELAPTNRFQYLYKDSVFDIRGSNHDLQQGKTNIGTVASFFRPAKRRSRNILPVKGIVERTHLASDRTPDVTKVDDLLTSVPYKIIAFTEDIRPPYMGTYTKSVSSQAKRRMARNSHYRGRSDTNYDYDSEAEWEPPNEGDEEIDLDDAMSEDEEGEEEMDDFLDDEHDHGRQRLFVGEMEPISSGLCWEGQDYTSREPRMNDYRLDFLHDSQSLPIDPFSTAHWTDSLRQPIACSKSEVIVKSDAGSNNNMLPPRQPLAPVSTPNTIASLFASNVAVPKVGTMTTNENTNPLQQQAGRATSTAKPLKMVHDDLLPAFKQAIDGSDLTKAGLIEILKKQFPKCSKDAIKDTLGLVAVRVGQKEAEKRWALV